MTRPLRPLYYHAHSSNVTGPTSPYACRGRAAVLFLTTATFVMWSCRLLKGFAKTLRGKYRLWQADKTQQGRNSCPWLPATCPGDMVMRMSTVITKPQAWCNVCTPCFKPITFRRRLRLLNVECPKFQKQSEITIQLRSFHRIL